MTTRFEISASADRFCFRLLGDDGDVLLQGLPCEGKIAAQNEVLHARNAIRSPERLVAHVDEEGRHFMVLKDRDGTVLARSTRVASELERDRLQATIRAAAAAPLVMSRGTSRRTTA